MTAKCFAQSLEALSKRYPNHEKIYVILDNWPVHFHKRVTKFVKDNPRIELVPLPTYSPWLNAIEKVWRWVRQRLTHTHPWANDFRLFQEQVRSLFGTLDNGSVDILQYVGLSG